MTDTYLAISGLYPLAFDEVSAFVGGLDCGDYTVDSTGTIYVPFGSDAGGLMTAEYLASLSPYTGEQATRVDFDAGGGTASYIVPIVIGVAYNSDGQGMRAIMDTDTKSPSGPGIGKTRRGHQVGFILSNTVALSVGTNTGNLQSMKLTDASQLTALSALDMFTGVKWDVLQNDYEYDTRVYWRADRPVPATVAAYDTFANTEDR